LGHINRKTLHWRIVELKDECNVGFYDDWWQNAL